MKKHVWISALAVYCCLILFGPAAYSQRLVFDPITPAPAFWEGETLYTETGKLKIDFRLMSKKISEVTLQNLSTGQELQLSSANFIYETELQLQPGANELAIWATKKKSKFDKHLQVFFNPHQKTERLVYEEGDCPIQVHGTYTFSPQIGSTDIVISRDSKHDFPVHFLAGCCDEKDLSISVEDPRQQWVGINQIQDNVYGFTAHLAAYENPYIVRISCKGKKVGEQRILVKFNKEAVARLDTAVIFAVSKHNRKSRKLGWVDLKYSMNDALALKYVLQNRYGFKVQIIADPTWEDIHDTMEGLKSHRWDKLDQLFVFFSGHGHLANGRGYLIPSNVSESIKTYYKMEDLREQVDEIGCNNITLCIDACFASTFLERGGRDIPVRRGTDVHNLLSSDLPFRYFIGSAPANKEVIERGIFVKDAKEDKYKILGKKFKVSEFMMAFLKALSRGDKEYESGPIPIWYIGRKIEEIYRPKKLINGQRLYARATRFGSQHDKGFHFIPDNPLP